METTRRRLIEIALGIGLALVLVLAVVVVWESFRGRFSNKVTVSATLSQAGDALEQGDIVTYEDVIVGEVATASGSLDGSAVATLKLDPAKAAVIPTNVLAIAVPASLFGLTRIELVPPATTAGRMLANGDVIQADRSPAAESLQTALANAYTLLTSIHPAELDAALTSLATALDGQGANLGTLLSQADSYLSRIAPHLPELDDTVRSLATVTNQIAKNAPALLSSLRNTLVIAQGILASKRSVASLLAVAPQAVSDAQALLNPQTVNDAVTILRNEGPVLDAFDADPNALPKTIDGFKQFADTFSKTMSSGPYAKAALLLTGVNFVEVFDAAGGGQGHAFDSIANPPQYTAADCPRYAGADGPNCGATAGAAGQFAQLLTTGTDYGGTSSSVGSKSEIFTVRSAAQKITGLPISQLPGSLVDVLLGPLLRGMPTVIG